MAAPAVKIEVEFTAGVWADVTADLDYGQGIMVSVGRTSPTQTPQTSSMTLALRNPLGKYTPGLQVLTDGTAAPYYPNVVPRKRIRYSTAAGVRFLGYVQSWSSLLDNGATGRCQVQAVDRMDQLSRVTMQTAIQQEIMSAGPSSYWPLTDAVGATTAANLASIATPLTLLGTTAPIVFGDLGPGVGDGTGAKFAPTSVSVGQMLLANLNRVALAGSITFEVMVNLGTTLPAWVSVGNPMSVAGLSCGIRLEIDVTSTGQAMGVGPSLLDGGWHHIALSYSTGTGLVTTYVDGVASSTFSPLGDARAAVAVGDSIGAYYGDTVAARFRGNIGQVALTPGALGAPALLARAKAMLGWYGETVSDRIKRFLGYAGLTSSDWTVDTSTVPCGSYPQGGKTVLAACQDMAVTEGGGSVFYVVGGSARFTNRAYRNSATVALSIDADLDGDRNYQPAIDSQTLVNSVTAERAAESGTLSSVIVTDAASLAANGVFTGPQITSYATTDSDVKHNAEQILASNRTPGFRLPQIGVDLLTATHSLATALQSVQIGSRVRVTNLPKGAAPATQVDVIVEGWTETAKVDTYTARFDTSPADNPAAAIYDTARYQCAGQTLNASITAAATSLAIATTAGLPVFTAAGGNYPLTITVGAEHIRLNSAPGGSTSPQTFTGVTRGVDGTAASAQSAGAAVNLFPLSTYTL